MNRRSRLATCLTLLVAAMVISAPLTASARGQARGGKSPQMRSAPSSFPSSRSMSSRDDLRRRTTVERTDSGITRSTVVTNGRGETMTSTTSVVRDADGSRSVQRERTGFDDRTSTTSANVQRTDDGVTRTQTVTTPSGNTITVTKGEDGRAIVERSSDRTKDERIKDERIKDERIKDEKETRPVPETRQ
jgi:hypothetical protein